MKSVLLEMEKLRKPNSGLGQFCLHLGKEFASANPQDLELNFYVPASQGGIFGDRFTYMSHSPLHKIVPASARMDVWHCMHQGSKYLPASRATRLILTIHDLNFLQKYSGLKRKLHLHALRQKVKRAAAITFISKYAEQEARENLVLPAVPSKVIYNGNSLEFFPGAARPRFAPSGKFIFAIGIISEKKNFHTLVRMLEGLKNISLVIAGNP